MYPFDKPKNHTTHLDTICLWVSKLRYGLQLCNKVRLSESDQTSANMKSIQLTQNRMLRAINNTRIKDKISTRSLLEKFGLLSVNQLAAKIKLVEVWKSIHQEGNPIGLEPYNLNLSSQNLSLRTQANRVFNDSCRLKKSESSFNIDAARLWNAAPKEITQAICLNSAKRKIDSFCKNLPIWKSIQTQSKSSHNQ